MDIDQLAAKAWGPIFNPVDQDDIAHTVLGYLELVGQRVHTAEEFRLPEWDVRSSK